MLLGSFPLNGHTTGFRDKQLTEPQERSAQWLLSEWSELDTTDSGNKVGNEIKIVKERHRPCFAHTFKKVFGLIFFRMYLTKMCFRMTSWELCLCQWMK